jgi:ribosomal protein L7Ae-like RNA K-turn-binding protein
VRLVLDPEGDLLVDPKGGSFGRGAWLHARPDCVRRGVPGGIARTLKATVRATPEAVADRLRAAGRRRLEGLLAAAMGAKKLAVGSGAVEEAAQRGEVRLVFVANDARAAASSSAVLALVEQGRSLPLLTKEELGALFGRSEVGVAGVLDEGLAVSLREAAELSIFTLPSKRSQKADAPVATEAP